MARLFTALKSDMGGISGLAEGLAGAGAGMAQGMQEGVKLGLAMRQAEQSQELGEQQLKKLKYENALHSYKLGGTITPPTGPGPLPGAALENGGPIENQPSSTPDRQGFDKVAAVNPSVAVRLQQRYDHAQAVLADPTSTPDERLEAEVWIGESRREASEFLQSDEVVAHTESQYRQQIRTWAEQAGLKEPVGLNSMTGTELEETLRTTGLAWQNAWRRAQMTDEVQRISQGEVNEWIEKKGKGTPLPDDAQDAVEKIQMGPPADIMSRADLKAWYDKALTELAVGLADPTVKNSYETQLQDIEGQLALSRKALDDYEQKRTWAEGVAGSHYPAAEGSGLAYDVTAAFQDNPIFAARLEAFVGEHQATVFSNAEYIKGMLKEIGAPEPTSKDQFEADQYWSNVIKRYLTNHGMTVDDLADPSMRGRLKAGKAQAESSMAQDRVIESMGLPAPSSFLPAPPTPKAQEGEGEAGASSHLLEGRAGPDPDAYQIEGFGFQTPEQYAAEQDNPETKAGLGVQLEDRALRIQGEIERLEAEKQNISGRGAAEKRRRITSHINKLKKQLEVTGSQPAPSMAREDGTSKGPGWLGSMPMNDGSDQVATELSITVGASDVGQSGEDVLIPLLVPTLTRGEVEHLTDGKEATDAIVKKAIAHARKQIKAGKSPFKQ